MDARKFQRAALDSGLLNIRIHSQENNSWVGVIEDPRLSRDYDDIGALYYVVAVVLIYGLSIVMMIASHIRKNKQDNQLRTYLKEMVLLRKKVRREKLFDKMSAFTSITTGSFKKKPTGDGSPKPGKKSETAEVSKTPSSSQEPAEEKEALNSRKESDNDSVFLLPGDFCIDMSRLDIPSPKPDTKTQINIQIQKEKSSVSS
ncbi:uncharacterized protein LOC124255046 [Haliotis rubra]|uniref:uncharacterized protein LOC124255046 n=1 Tax=Haliotis rubra TaxID=36100 RepID=UPI001EE5A754|nr:uncharacterized protein LOC124255046 [Haliotis rubra]